MSRLDRLMRPKSIAVLGAGWALNVIEQCRKMGFAGQVWPVHPTKGEIGGLKAYASLADLPGVPDATFIGVNRFATIDVVAELSAMGAGGAICFASGWTEAGEPELQAKLVAAAGDMPILGPNCYGVINYLDGALLWPDQHGGVPVTSGVALVSQSSNIVINLGMQKRGLPVAYVACLGNAAVVGLAELVLQYYPKATGKHKALLMEFVLYGLSAYSLISKKILSEKIEFRDLMGSMFSGEDEG